jgi:ribosome-binding protein aMBF1 (putative translation factor)
MSQNTKQQTHLPPQQQSHQDWSTVTITNPDKQKKIKVILEKKGDTSIKDSLVKIDNETENFAIQKIPQTLSKEIMQARVASKITQKDLAVKLNIQQSVYSELENGKAIYDAKTKQLITKLQNVLKIKFLNR